MICLSLATCPVLISPVLEKMAAERRDGDRDEKDDGVHAMKKIVFLGLILMMATSVTAYAEKMCTSRSFEVMNWKGEVEPPADNVVEMEEPEEQATPVDDQFIPPATLVFTDEEALVGMEEQPSSPDDEEMPVDVHESDGVDDHSEEIEEAEAIIIPPEDAVIDISEPVEGEM